MKAAWQCKPCEVEGYDPEPVSCWNCGSEDVKVTCRLDESGSGGYIYLTDASRS